MSIIPTKDDTSSDIVTVQQFAEQYRVDASVVRGWVKMGYINWTLVGPRHMRRVRVSEIVKPITPVQVKENNNGQTAGTGQASGRTGGARSVSRK